MPRLFYRPHAERHREMMLWLDSSVQMWLTVWWQSVGYSEEGRC